MAGSEFSSAKKHRQVGDHGKLPAGREKPANRKRNGTPVPVTDEIIKEFGWLIYD
jgi:hypothetical protein